MNLGEGETEFLTLEYPGGDKLYVPVSNLDLISRYSGARPIRRRSTRSAAANGKKQREKPPNRCATPRRNFSTCTRSAQRARVTRSGEAA